MPRKGPAIVLAHDLGATKEMRLDTYCEKFSNAGYVCLAFDYRCIGHSTGKPRGQVDVDMQYQDWIQAIKYIRGLDIVDRNRVGIFSITFGTGNAIRVAAQNYGLKAVICQNPLLGSLAYLGFKDLLCGTDDNPITVPIHSVPGHASLTKSYDAQAGYKSLLPEYMPHHPNAIPARFVIKVPCMRPGAQISSVKAPILFVMCGKDNIAPPQRALKCARMAPNATIVWFDNLSHFQIYHGEAFEMATGYYLQFLKDHLPVTVHK